ncbi:ATP-binding protein [Lapidilactobacillus luobeiensis]|uniref:ATP-binding protein n=1 Tax=Lapidilactobacillus luobeiensis TaxID=2950371 RepID=UPI0021C48D93|nr:ATP-binding protein [Lapidilactobacillus luobeiensis]
MTSDSYILDYAPSAVQHLGVGLYKQLPQALAELITNAWDADATAVNLHIDYFAKKITVSDNGCGMSHAELNSNFLRVAKNRRLSQTNSKTPRGRLVTGKKGLGKLALFGIANRIQVTSVKNGLENSFEMNFMDIKNTDEDKQYHPKAIENDSVTSEENGTTIVIDELSLKNITKLSDLKRSLARRFNKYSASDFLVLLTDESGNVEKLDEDAFELSVIPDHLEFTFRFPEDFSDELQSNTALQNLKSQGIYGAVFTKFTPLSSANQGFSVLSRGKLASERSQSQFSDRANDYFYTYATGYFNVDVIDNDQRDDYISTDRQAILWNSNDSLERLRENLDKLMNVIQSKWRAARQNTKKKKQEQSLNENPDANEVLHSPDVTPKEIESINTVSELLEDDQTKISAAGKDRLISQIAQQTDTYKRNHSVYKKLIPTSFSVPSNIITKIQMLREEMVAAATDEADPNRFILTQGLLLRAMIDSTCSIVIIKNLDNLHNLGIVGQPVSTPKRVYDMPLKDKLFDSIEFLSEMNQLSGGQASQTLKSEIGSIGVIKKLDQLMHDSEQWPQFPDLKLMWDKLAPILALLFKYC